MKINGKLDDAVWAQAAWTEDFVDIEDSGRTGRTTTADASEMLLGREVFLVAAGNRSRMSGQHLAKHDSVIFYNPDFEVFIDPNGDSHEYYEFK